MRGQGQYAFVPEDETTASVEFDYSWQPDLTDPGILQALPSVFFLFVSLAMWQSDPHEFEPWAFAEYHQRFVGFLIVPLLAVCCSIYLCRARCAAWRTVLAWGLAAIPLGLAAPLSIWALSVPPITEECDRCHRSRPSRHAAKMAPCPRMLKTMEQQ